MLCLIKRTHANASDEPETDAPSHRGALGGLLLAALTIASAAAAPVGANQVAELGLGKKLLEQYPWARFEPHPEWAPGCFAAGIPGGMRVIYLPRRNIYNWSGITVNHLVPGLPYAAFYFDPATGRRFDQGIVTTASGSWNTPNVPSPQDWVLVMQAKM